MGMNDWQAGLQAFLDSNPDLPQGEEVVEQPVEDTPSKQPRLDIILEKKGRGGKIATIVTGFTLDDEELAQLASKMKASLGTGGSARGGEILIQGDKRDAVLKFLTKQGYKARII
ncbi:MAG: translation initiation factor [Muribaculaceae bacterium]|nr:translation initiation factor [Muribaculaceae bacterium]